MFVQTFIQRAAHSNMAEDLDTTPSETNRHRTSLLKTFLVLLENFLNKH